VAAIQGLHILAEEMDCRLAQMLEEKDRRIGDLEERNIELEARLARSSMPALPMVPAPRDWFP